MNEPTSSSRDRVNFPSAIGADAGERQTAYREHRQSSGRKDAAGERGGQGTDAAAIASQTEALITLVQELTQQNHLLSEQVAQLEGTITSMQESAAAAPRQALPADASTDAQVAYLLNQLEFAQQTNQRQVIRIESLVQQVNTDRLQLAQLEQDNAAFQHRCRTQTSRIDQLEQRCDELQQRLQRQQDYTLQLKAALDKCLEVPPPSYATLESLGVSGPAEPMTAGRPGPNPPAPAQQIDHTTTAPAVDDKAASPTALTSPLLPKAGDIPPWSQSHVTASKRSPAVAQRNNAIKTIEPLKPALQVPQMSRFKTTLFNLAHQPQGAATSPDSVVSHDLRSRGESLPEPLVDSAIGSTPMSPAESSTDPSQDIPQPVTAPSATSDPSSTKTSASNDDAFWADLVQLVAEIDSAPSPDDGTPLESDRPQQGSNTASPSPVISQSSSPARKPKSQDMAQGVDTLFDVVLQGAKAIANQFKSSEDGTLETENKARLDTNEPVVSESAASAPSQPLPPPIRAVKTDEAQDQSVRPQSPSRRHRIDLPTFLRPQPQ